MAAGALAFLVPVLKDLNLRKVYEAGKVVGREGLLPAQSKIFDWLPRMHGPQLDAKTHDLVDRWTRPSDWLMTLDYGVVLVGAGAIVGLRVSIALVAGGVI